MEVNKNSNILTQWYCSRTELRNKFELEMGRFWLLIFKNLLFYRVSVFLEF